MGDQGPDDAYVQRDFAFVFVTCLGDANCDGQVSFADINPFNQLQSDPDGWCETYPGCPILNGDINDDGAVDFADINPFTTLLSTNSLPIICSN